MIGVIPAAGKGTRWAMRGGTIFKELLPCGGGHVLLTRTIEAMAAAGAASVLLITSEEKIQSHVHYTRWSPVPVYMILQTKHQDLWGAIQESFEFPSDRYLFAMPDTYWPLLSFAKSPHGEQFEMWTFRTDRPERFGVLRPDGMVVNKQASQSSLCTAWGLLSWTRLVVKLWAEMEPADYTEAINMATREYGLHTHRIDYYHDMARLEDYQALLLAQTLGKVK